jgi:hypothetical protein
MKVFIYVYLEFFHFWSNCECYYADEQIFYRTGLIFVRQSIKFEFEIRHFKTQKWASMF